MEDDIYCEVCWWQLLEFWLVSDNRETWAAPTNGRPETPDLVKLVSTDLRPCGVASRHLPSFRSASVGCFPRRFWDGPSGRGVWVPTNFRCKKLTIKQLREKWLNLAGWSSSQDAGCVGGASFSRPMGVCRFGQIGAWFFLVFKVI